MATPVLQDIRHAFPHAHISALGGEPIRALLEHNPNIDAFLPFSKKEIPQLVQTIQEKQFDLGILLTGSFSSAWLFFRARIPRRLGYRGHFRSLLLSPGVRKSEFHEKQHLVKTYKELLSPLDIAVSDTAPKLFVTDEEKQKAWMRLSHHGIAKEQTLIGINPGAAYGSAKCWLPERFRTLTEELLKKPNVRIVYFGDTNGKSLVDTICKDLPVLNVAGATTIRELMAMISHCSLLVTNDSGPMHMASALSIPVVALFGSTSAIKTGPYQHGTIIHKQVSCSPCYKRTCPIDFRCMKRITVEDVQTTIERVLYAT